MAGGVALLAYAHKLKRLLSDTETSQASPAADSIVNPIAVQQPVPARAPSALDKPFGDTFPISVWIDDAPFVVNGRVSLYVMDKHKAAIRDRPRGRLLHSPGKRRQRRSRHVGYSGARTHKQT